MKILLVSIFAPHFFNWAEQLRDSGHEIYWLDVFDSNTRVTQLDFVHQIIGWRYKLRYPGRYTIKRKAQKLHKFMNTFNERKLEKVFEEKLKEINPDVVHSFALHLSCFPILEVMKKYSSIIWICSTWGSDLFYHKNDSKEALKIKDTLLRINYLFVDCKRDFKIADQNGFKGELLGVFPGRGGFDFSLTDGYILPFEQRNVLMIKGYQGTHGRCIEVLRAVSQLKEELKALEIIVFGADEEVKEFYNSSSLFENFDNIKILGKIPHQEIIELLGKSLIYVGNSCSDGMPNTLLEAIIMGVFPIQSNPGNATAEIIENGKNGFLIENPEDIKTIKNHILIALGNMKMIKGAIEDNLLKIKPTLEREFIRTRVLQRYSLVEERL